MELALLHKYGIITTLPFSKYASPIFAQRKPNGKLHLLVDLRKINTLITDDYQQQPSGQQTNGCSTAYGWEKLVLQT